MGPVASLNHPPCVLQVTDAGGGGRWQGDGGGGRGEGDGSAHPSPDPSGNNLLGVGGLVQQGQGLVRPFKRRGK